MFCSVLSGAMFVLEFSRSGVIRDGKCVTERMQCFRHIMVPHMVFVFFSLLFRSWNNGFERDAPLGNWCIMCCFDKDLSFNLVS